MKALKSNALNPETLLLALEQSAGLTSIALLRGGRVVAAREWDEDRRHRQRLCIEIPALLQTAGVAIKDITAYAVGLGPGSFTGIRMALSTLQGLAMPREREVIGITSAEAIAWDSWKQDGQAPIVVAGDARRGRLWIARMHEQDRCLALDGKIRLEDAGSCADAFRQARMVLTPDWDTIGQHLEPYDVPGQTLVVRESRKPKATAVGELAWCQSEAGIPRRPLQPVYLHPAVFVAPRFPARGTSTA